MRVLLGAGIRIAFGMFFIICIISGCAGDDPTEPVVPPQPLEEEDVNHAYSIPKATRVWVNPKPGSRILPDTRFVLRFDAPVMAASVNHRPATGVTGTIWLAQPDLELGTVWLEIEWTNYTCLTHSRTVGPYLVVADRQSPKPLAITHGMVRNGEVDVDPAPINWEGFWFDFNVPMTGTVKLTDEAGNDLNWIGRVAGSRAVLTPVAGQELANETTYKIEIDVRDSDGSRLRETITFVTKPK